jgi:hypothetical protein
MNRSCLVLIFSLLGASGLFASRGGRGDALHLFGASSHTPHLLLYFLILPNHARVDGKEPFQYVDLIRVAIHYPQSRSHNQ